MIPKNSIKQIQSLQQKKFRKETGLFIAEGKKIVGEIIRSGWNMQGIYALSKWIAENQKVLSENPTHVISEVSEKEMQRISTLTNSSDVLAVVPVPQKEDYVPADINQSFSLCLDNIQDPGNLGTIIRTADWFGIRQIFCSEDTVDVYNPKVIQSSMGSFLRVKTHYLYLPKFLEECKGKIPIIGASLDGENLFKAELPKKALLVVGNESNGICREVLPYIERKFQIPSFNVPLGNIKADSLNASVAAALFMAELRR